MRALPVLTLLATLLLPGCADMTLSNPFETTSDVNEVYYDQFPDIAIPSDMSVDRSRTLISVAQDGTKVGLLTVEGRVERSSLSNAVMQNMRKRGWALRGMVAGGKTLHIYEKDQRYTVVYLYDQVTTTAMEIWVTTRLNEGALAPVGGMFGGSGEGSGQPAFYLTPLPESGTNSAGGVRQEGLNQ